MMRRINRTWIQAQMVIPQATMTPFGNAVIGGWATLSGIPLADSTPAAMEAFVKWIHGGLPLTGNLNISNFGIRFKPAWGHQLFMTKVDELILRRGEIRGASFNKDILQYLNMKMGEAIVYTKYGPIIFVDQFSARAIAETVNELVGK